MTDVGNMQAGAVRTAQVAARPTIAVVPLKGLPIVAVVVAFVIASIAGNWLWALTVARYSSPAGHAGSLPDVSQPA